MTLEFQEGNFKIYTPLIKQDQLEIPFRHGKYVYLASTLSGELQDIPQSEIQNLLQENSKIFEEDLIEVFPKKSQPKIFLREYVDTNRDS